MIGVAGIVSGVSSIVQSRKRAKEMETVATKRGKSAEELVKGVDIDISNAVVEEAVRKAAEKAAEKLDSIGTIYSSIANRMSGQNSGGNGQPKITIG